MHIYISLFIICYYYFNYISVKSIFESVDNKNSFLFYLLSIFILILSMPIYHFKLETSTSSVFVSLSILILTVIFSQRLFNFNKSTLKFTIPFNILCYFTFCYFLSLHLMN